MLQKFDCIVVGGGLAGVSAAIEASTNNRTVLLIESAPQLGGRIAGWKIWMDGADQQMQHGYHAVFPSYTNCRDLMTLAQIDLIAEDPYLIYDKTKCYSFATVRGRWWRKLLAMWNMRMFSLRDSNLILLNFVYRCIWFKKDAVRKRYGSETFSSFCVRARLPPSLAQILHAVARTFFSSPDELTVADMIHATHLYLFRPIDGLAAQTLKDAHGEEISDKLRALCDRRHVPVICGKSVESLYVDNSNQQCVALKKGETFVSDVVILATDRATTAFLLGAPTPRCIGHHMSLRLWCTAEIDRDLPTVFTVCGTEELDFVFLCHRRETDAQKWANARDNGAVIELHSYCTKRSKRDAHDTLIRELQTYAQLYDVFHTEVVFGKNFQRADARHLEKNGRFVAGDWACDDAFLMEGAVHSGKSAAQRMDGFLKRLTRLSVSSASFLQDPLDFQTPDLHRC